MEQRLKMMVLTLVALAAGARPSLAAKTVDVLVVGAGPAGIAAAGTAARLGASTLLMEQGAQLGGNMTSGGVNFPGLFHAGGRQVIDGFGYMTVTNAVALAGGTLPDFFRDVGARHWEHQITVDIPLYVAATEEALSAAGVEIAYHAAPLELKPEAGGWRVRFAAAGDEDTVLAKTVVDCTGNGAVAAKTGARLLREPETAPGSFCYRLGGYDPARIDAAAVERAYATALAAGRVRPGDQRCGMARFLADRGGIWNYVFDADNSTGARRTATNMRGRASMLRMFRFLRSCPGFEHLTVESMAAETGVRETCRVEGDYVVTLDDYVTGRRFPDALCHAYYPVDLHSKDGVVPEQLSPGVVPAVPLRALCVKGRRNLLVAGRCLSADRLAMAAIRVEAACMATGQAAGAAAALAARRGCDAREVPAAEIRKALVAAGAVAPDVESGNDNGSKPENKRK